MERGPKFSMVELGLARFLTDEDTVIGLSHKKAGAALEGVNAPCT